jgi:DNA (cytosine-5)-methyltransferase 1
MFAGIGGFRAGLTRAGGFQCVGHCEIDKYADASYRAIHDIGEEEQYYQDARKIDPNDLPHFDLLCGGFPCQAFSNAGKRKGFDDARGTLFFEIARLAQARRPPYLLLENVPGLLSHDKGPGQIEPLTSPAGI